MGQFVEINAREDRVRIFNIRLNGTNIVAQMAIRANACVDALANL